MIRPAPASTSQHNTVTRDECGSFFEVGGLEIERGVRVLKIGSLYVVVQ
jgi:hypothetical protein